METTERPHSEVLLRVFVVKTVTTALYVFVVFRIVLFILHVFTYLLCTGRFFAFVDFYTGHLQKLHLRSFLS